MIVTLLTDFGLADHYVGVMKGVVLGIDARIRLVDLTHEIAPGAIEAGAFALVAAYPFFPPGTVHVAVVDPGVGSERRAIVIDTGGARFVGPDNGLFSYVLEREPAARVVDVTSSPHVRRPLSSTFHGRDLFAPVGAALATGVAVEELGPPLEAPVRLAPLKPTPAAGGALLGRVLHVDRFGNCVTSFTSADLGDGVLGRRVRVGGAEIAEIRRQYAGGEPGAPFLIWGSTGFLEISVNGASAAAVLGVRTGDAVEVSAPASAAP